ncbi:MAG: hypothetical protein HKN44_00150 [Ilumatobacter sp.]|nr:hypothetical protein [Ilumatobacter sp.]
MFEFTTPRNVPAAGVDPIRSPYSALAVILGAMSPESRHETIIMTLDRERRGRTVLVVIDTVEPDSLLGIVDMLAEFAIRDADAGGVVIATVRPDGTVDPDDMSRWEEADDVLADVGLELVEWFVLGTSIHSPRELAGVPPRW